MQKLSTKQIFGLVLSIIFLGFYAVTWGAILFDVIKPKATMRVPDNDGFFYVATTVAGIAAALAVAILGATPSTQTPSVKVLSNTPSSTSANDKFLERITMLFLLAWVIIGFLAVYFGLMSDKPVLSEEFESSIGDEKKVADYSLRLAEIHTYLSSYGTTWFGMALSAIFVYLKVEPVPQESTQGNIYTTGKNRQNLYVPPANFDEVDKSNFVNIPDTINGVSIKFKPEVDRRVTSEMLDALKSTIVSSYDGENLTKLKFSSASEYYGPHECPSRHKTGNGVDINEVNGKPIRNFSNDPIVKSLVTKIQEKFESAPERRENFGPALSKKEGRNYNPGGNHTHHIHFSVNGDHDLCSGTTRKNDFYSHSDQPLDVCDI